jgi:undecaprenyl-phosphate 4-deoxy-4-formamido-L-arabinose transferase
MTAPRISAVIPVYNEEANLPELNDRMMKALDLTGKPWELVYVDDGSADRSLELLSGFAAKDRRVRVVEFNRNYGQHAAVFAGLAQTRGEIVVTLDADLQNPPEEIPKLVAKWKATTSWVRAEEPPGPSAGVAPRAW